MKYCNWHTYSAISASTSFIYRHTLEHVGETWIIYCEKKRLDKTSRNSKTSPVVYSTDRSKAVVPVLVLRFVDLWFILRGDLFYVLPCVNLFLWFLVVLALRFRRLGKKELILVFFICLFDLRLFGFVCCLFLLVSGKGCGL